MYRVQAEESSKVQTVARSQTFKKSWENVKKNSAKTYAKYRPRGLARCGAVGCQERN